MRAKLQSAIGCRRDDFSTSLFNWKWRWGGWEGSGVVQQIKCVWFPGTHTPPPHLPLTSHPFSLWCVKIGYRGGVLQNRLVLSGSHLSRSQLIIARGLCRILSRTEAAAMRRSTATPATIFWGGSGLLGGWEGGGGGLRTTGSPGTGGSICTAEISEREFGRGGGGWVGGAGRKLQSNFIIREKTLLPLSSADSQLQKLIMSSDLAEYDTLISLFF